VKWDAGLRQGAAQDRGSSIRFCGSTISRATSSPDFMPATMVWNSWALWMDAVEGDDDAAWKLPTPISSAKEPVSRTE